METVLPVLIAGGVMLIGFATWIGCVALATYLAYRPWRGEESRYLWAIGAFVASIFGFILGFAVSFISWMVYYHQHPIPTETKTK